MGYHLAQRVKHLLAMQESWIRSLGWEYPLEKEMVTHSSILAWKIPWMEEPGTLQSMGLLRVRHDNKREDSIHGHHQMVNTEIRVTIFFAAKDGEALYSQQKQDWELTVAQIMNSLLPNSDLN